MNYTNLFGGAAVFGMIAACWGKIKYVISKMLSIIIGVIEFGEESQAYVWYYLRDSKEYKQLTHCKKKINYNYFYIKKFKSKGLVAIQYYVKDIVFFRKGWKIFALDTVGNAYSNGGNNNNSSKPKLIYLRFQKLDCDKIISEAFHQYNIKLKGLVNEDSRFRIIKKTGSGGGALGRIAASINEKETEKPVAVQNNKQDKVLWYCYDKIYGYSYNELEEDYENENPFNDLAISSDVEKSVDFISKWYQSRDWYYEHNVPWRIGVGLYGKPGTGKTKLAKTIAQYLKIPIYIFDIASMNNKDFIDSWNEARQNTPCEILIEDIDNIFNGRTNILGEMGGGLSFDCFINAISGVENSDGILLIITTNDISKIDPALGNHDQHGISTRPGRLDRIIHLGELDINGRYKLANRILKGYNDLIEKVVKEGDGETGAQFQERCTNLALEEYWKNENIIKNKIT